MPKYEHHIFVCTNEREASDPRGCCSHRGGKLVLEQFKKRLSELGVKKRMRANSSGCLNACAKGPSVVIYPQGVWYGGVKQEDVEEIIQEHLLGGRIVTRLHMDI